MPPLHGVLLVFEESVDDISTLNVARSAPNWFRGRVFHRWWGSGYSGPAEVADSLAAGETSQAHPRLCLDIA